MNRTICAVGGGRGLKICYKVFMKKDPILKQQLSCPICAICDSFEHNCVQKFVKISEYC